MAQIVVMPQSGQTMEEGIVVEWLKKEGEHIEKGEILLTIDTGKASLEVESDYSGILRKILVTPENGPVPCLTPIAIIGEASENIVVDQVLADYANSLKNP